MWNDNQASRYFHSPRGDAHSRVTNYNSTHAAFRSIEEARRYMEKQKITKWKEVIKETALETTPTNNNDPYYAVAYGEKAGIKRAW